MKRLRSRTGGKGNQNAVFVPKRPAKVVAFELGSSWRLEGRRVVIEGLVSPDRVAVRHCADDRQETVSVACLVPWVPTESAEALGARLSAFANHSEQAWQRAREEHACVNALLERGDLSRRAMAAAAASLGMSDRQFRRKLTRYMDLKTLEAFLPRVSGPKGGTTYLQPEVERLVAEELRRALKCSPDVAVDDLYPIIKAACLAMHFRPPGRSTISRRLRHERGQIVNLPSEIGNELAYKRSRVRGPIRIGEPLSVVEMDHTVCDVHIVDGEFGLPIGRPVLTLAMDRATRVILGIVLTLEAPSRLTVGLCMHHAVFSKQPWLRSLGLPDACWPGFGLPAVLFSDNAKEFHAQSLKRSAQLYNIDLQFRPPGDPAAGGIIERAIGTYMRKIRLLPGSSYSRLLVDIPRNASKAARYTIAELEQYLATQVSILHKTTHQGIGMSPLTAWEKAWTVNGNARLPRVPESSEAFLLSFLPGMWRTVTREGVELFCLRYRSPALQPLVGVAAKWMVRFDPRCMSVVYVETPDGHIPVPLSPAQPIPFSLWEWREIRKLQIEEGRARDPARLAMELLANRAMIQGKAREPQKWHARRRLARGKAWESAQKVPESIDRTLTAPASPTRLVCRVEE